MYQFSWLCSWVHWARFKLTMCLSPIYQIQMYLCCCPYNILNVIYITEYYYWEYYNTVIIILLVPAVNKYKKNSNITLGTLCCRHDERLMAKNSSLSSTSAPLATTPVPCPLPTQQFGVSLQFIKEKNDGEIIPPLVRQCVTFLSTPDGLLNSISNKFCFYSNILQYIKSIITRSSLHGAQWGLYDIADHISHYISSMVLAALGTVKSNTIINEYTIRYCNILYTLM